MARIAAGANQSGKQLSRERLAAGKTERHQQPEEQDDAKAPVQQLLQQPEEKRATRPAEQTGQHQQVSKPQQAQGGVGSLAGAQNKAEPPQGMQKSKAAAEPPAGQETPAAVAKGQHAEPQQRSEATTAAGTLMAQAEDHQTLLQSPAEKEQAAHTQQHQQQPPPFMAMQGSLLQNQLSGLSDAQSQQLSSQAGPTVQLQARGQARKPSGLPAEPATAQHQQPLSQAGPAEQLQLQAVVQMLSRPEHQNPALQSLRRAAESPAAWLMAQQPQGADLGAWWAPQQHQGLQPEPQWVQQLNLTNGYVQQPQKTQDQQQQRLLLAQLRAQLARGASGGSFVSPVSAQGNDTALAAALAASMSQGAQTLPAVALAAPNQPLADPTADALRAAQSSPLAPVQRLAEQGQCGMPPQVPLADLQPPLSGAAAAASAAPAALGNDNFDWAAWMQPEELVGGIAGRTKRQASRRQPPQSQHEQAASAADPDFTLPVEESAPGRQRRRSAAQHMAQSSEQPPSRQKRARSRGQQPLRQGTRRKAPPWEEASEDGVAAAGPGSAAEGRPVPAAARSRRSAARGQHAQRPRQGTRPSKGLGRRRQQGSRSFHDGSPAGGTSSSDPEISEAEGPHLPSQALGKSRLSSMTAGVAVGQQPAARLTRRASLEAVLAG